jgi:hypothetical protein
LRSCAAWTLFGSPGSHSTPFCSSFTKSLLMIDILGGLQYIYYYI